MFAEVNSSTCLSQSLCLPVGGYSTWASLGRGPLNGSLPVVLATAALDAFGLFHELATGLLELVAASPVQLS